MVDYIRTVSAVFIGNGSLGLPILEKISDDPQFNLLAVFSGVDKPAGRNKILTPTVIAGAAKDLSLRLFKVEDINKNDNISILKKLNPEIIICTDFTQIIGDEILDLPKFGVLNIHPSLLPKYRGPSPMQTTIKNRDTRTGVSIIKMVKKMDAGPILAQIEAKLSRKVDYKTLKSGLAEIGAELIAELMPYYMAGEVQPTEQNDKLASYTKLFNKNDGEVKLTDDPVEVEAKIRAFQEWPKVYTILNGRKIFITEARLDKNKQIIIEKVKPEGKNEMKYADFIRGNSERLTFGK